MKGEMTAAAKIESKKKVKISNTTSSVFWVHQHRITLIYNNNKFNLRKAGRGRDREREREKR